MRGRNAGRCRASHMPPPWSVPPTSLTYRTLVRTATTLAPLAGLLDRKLGRTVALRRGALDRFRQWGAAHRDTGRPLAWFHAPSVGEGLQARAVLEAFRLRHPEWQFAYTYFSPSAEQFAASTGVDFIDCLPFDTVTSVEAILAALRPTLLVFTKLDIWPELATRAASRAVPTALVAGTVRPGSGRLGGMASAMLRPGYACLALAGAISDDDAARLIVLGTVPDRIRVTGDPRSDSVLSRVEAVSAHDPLLRQLAGAPMLVAGSTWPEDEAVLLDAFAQVRAQRPDARLMLVPHEPTPAALSHIERAAGAAGLPFPVRLATADGSSPLVLVDRVGVLATLYGAGALAWVGGGFGRAGLHSVLEPAAWRLPVLFGPRWEQSRDATALVAARAAVSITGRETLARQWLAWLEDPADGREAGARAHGLVMRERGAAARSVALLEELL